MDIGELSKKLASRAEEVAQYLFSNGKRKGQEYCVGSVSGEPGDSLKVHLTGNKAGVWKDFASGERGDLIDLWVAVKGITLVEAIKQIKEYLGIVEPTFTTTKQKTYKTPEKPSCKKPSEGSVAFEYLARERKLSEETLKAYQVGEMIDSKGAIILLPFKRSDKLTNIKYLRVERDERGKKVSWFISGCELILFGWQVIAANARTIVITEGELDAMSWYEYGISALSVPNGAKGHTWVENEFEHLERFDIIYLSFDMDEEGQKGAKELIDRLGSHRCRLVKLPYKDANECLQKGVLREEMLGLLDSAEHFDPSELKRPTNYINGVIEEFYPSDTTQVGFLPPWSKLQKYIQFRPGELSIWAGFNFHGKTTIISQIMLSAMAQLERVCLVSLETHPVKSLKKMTKQATGKSRPSIAHIRKAHDYYDGKLWIYDWVGVGNIDRIFEVWDYARRRYGVTQFVLDNLMRVGIGEEDYTGQKRFVNSLTEFATRNNVHVHLLTHTRKAENDHNPGSRLDVRGSGAITDLAHNVFVIWKNTKKQTDIATYTDTGKIAPENLLTQADATFVCDKQRDGDWIGRVSLWFDPESQQYTQTQYDPPIIYVPENEEEEL